jgi:hypothetical protein
MKKKKRGNTRVLTKRFFVVIAEDEKTEFMESFPGGNDAPRRRGRSSSRTDINPEVTKTACYIKHLFSVSFVALGF